MKAIFFFIGGNAMAFVYFLHLYLQLAELKKRRKRLLSWMFPLRFFLLASVLGTLFFFYPPMIPYIIAGLFSGRIAMHYFVKRKWFGRI
jgi:hypothetical protein